MRVYWITEAARHLANLLWTEPADCNFSSRLVTEIFLVFACSVYLMAAQFVCYCHKYCTDGDAITLALRSGDVCRFGINGDIVQTSFRHHHWPHHLLIDQTVWFRPIVDVGLNLSRSKHIFCSVWYQTGYWSFSLCAAIAHLFWIFFEYFTIAKNLRIVSAEYEETF